MSTATVCQRCGQPSSEFLAVEAGMRTALKNSLGETANQLPAQVCKVCHDTLAGSVSRGAKLRIEQHAREKNKQMLWKSRVNLVKAARTKMNGKMYAEAAVAYEKYLRVVEMAYDKQKGTLTPEVFGNTSKSKEITVIATAYWDLMRIYDTHPNYREKMLRASQKLRDFLPFSRIYLDIVKKAEAFEGSSKNPDVVRRFLRELKGKKGRCFIATAAFEAPMADEVQFLRRYRDEHLMNTFTGRAFVRTYYFVSPPIAAMIEKSEFLKRVTRQALRSAIQILK